MLEEEENIEYRSCNPLYYIESPAVSYYIYSIYKRGCGFSLAITLLTSLINVYISKGRN
ncbi:hypothetical protein F1880_008352 [Penicillium rolfsii]|nr:hypothetical protein F1880_008352 [Penicillium rolfsii]